MTDGSSLFKGAVDLSQMARIQQEQKAPDGEIAMLYDSEIDRAHQLVMQLQEKVKGREVNLDDFQKEVKERFLEIGFVVDIKWFQVEGERYKVPQIELVKRTQNIQFDHEQQAHEVTNDLLGLGESESSVIKVDSDKARSLIEGSYGGEKGHKH